MGLIKCLRQATGCCKLCLVGWHTVGPASKATTMAHYTITSKPVKFKAAHNKASFARIVAAANNGTITLVQLHAALTLTAPQAAAAAKSANWRVAAPKKCSGFRQNHTDFVGYLVRTGYLVAPKAT